MQPWFSSLTRRAWWLGTLIGALAAYALGYLPSTLMDLGAQTGQAAPVAEPAQWIVMLLAAGLGLAAGAVLSFAQWLALRRVACGAGIWIPANMLAWMVSMPLIFWGIDIAQKAQSMAHTVLIMAGVLLLIGVVAGAVHGIFLVHIASKSKAYSSTKLYFIGFNFQSNFQHFKQSDNHGAGHDLSGGAEARLFSCS